MLNSVKNYLESQKEILEECFDKINTINKYCSENFGKQGGGLSAGLLVDMVINDFLSHKINHFESFHSGESDCKIMGQNFSIKKITGKSNLALDWSKNKTGELQKEYFVCDILIFNLYSEKWFKNTNVIPSGLYLIPKEFCKSKIELKQNNKTNSLIDAKNLFKIMENSLENKLCIPITLSQTSKFTWSIDNGFQKL